jgi:hypothetical protein
MSIICMVSPTQYNIAIPLIFGNDFQQPCTFTLQRQIKPHRPNASILRHAGGAVFGTAP